METDYFFIIVILCAGVSILQCSAMQLVPVSRQIPQGIRSENGSSINDTGCGSESCLLDGIIPDINTHESNWASQLVTVRKNSADEHVVLTFNFNKNITVRLVELYLLNCPEWKIGAPSIALYGTHGSNFTSYFDDDFLGFNTPRECQTSCNSLSHFNLNIENRQPAYSTYHIVIYAFPQDIDWVYAGEVRFNNPADENQECPSEPSPELTTDPIVSSGVPIKPITTSESEPVTSTTETHSPTSVFSTPEVSITNVVGSLSPSTTPSHVETDPSSQQNIETASESIAVSVGSASGIGGLLLILIVIITAIIMAVLGMKRRSNFKCKGGSTSYLDPTTTEHDVLKYSFDSDLDLLPNCVQKHTTDHYVLDPALPTNPAYGALQHSTRHSEPDLLPNPAYGVRKHGTYHCDSNLGVLANPAYGLKTSHCDLVIPNPAYGVKHGTYNLPCRRQGMHRSSASAPLGIYTIPTNLGHLLPADLVSDQICPYAVVTLPMPTIDISTHTEDTPITT